MIPLSLLFLLPTAMKNAEGSRGFVFLISVAPLQTDNPILTRLERLIAYFLIAGLEQPVLSPSSSIASCLERKRKNI